MFQERVNCCIETELLCSKGTERTIDRTELFDRTKYKSSFPSSCIVPAELL